MIQDLSATHYTHSLLYIHIHVHIKKQLVKKNFFPHSEMMTHDLASKNVINGAWHITHMDKENKNMFIIVNFVF